MCKHKTRNVGIWGFLELSGIFIVFYVFSAGEPSAVKMIKMVSPALSRHLPPATEVSLIVISLFVLLSLLQDWKTFLLHDKNTILLWLIVLAAFLSTIWSINPQLTIRRSLLLTATTGFGIFLSFRYNIEQQLKLVASVILVLAILSLVCITLTSEGVMIKTHTGAWEGIFPHKNHLGKWMGVGIIVFLVVDLSARKIRVLYWGGLILCAVLMLGSQSVTPLIAVSACLLMFAFLHGLSKFSKRAPRALYLISCLILGITAFAWAYSNTEGVLQLLGRDKTLTNRTELWAILLDKAEVRPFLGYGYGAFWEGSKVGVSGEVEQMLGYYPFHAHNGFLDEWLGMGLAGLTVFLVWFGMSFFRVYKVGIQSQFRNKTDLWAPLYLLFFMVYNFAESDMLWPNSMIWSLLVAVVTSMLRKEKLKSQLQSPNSESVLTQPHDPPLGLERL